MSTAEQTPLLIDRSALQGAPAAVSNANLGGRRRYDTGNHTNADSAVGRPKNRSKSKAKLTFELLLGRDERDVPVRTLGPNDVAKLRVEVLKAIGLADANAVGWIRDEPTGLSRWFDGRY